MDNIALLDLIGNEVYKILNASHMGTIIFERYKKKGILDTHRFKDIIITGIMEKELKKNAGKVPKYVLKFPNNFLIIFIFLFGL